MTVSKPLRIAILAHSTNPRGGVVHALELAEALVMLGHEAVLHAPDPSGRGFFRTSRCGAISVKARPVTGGTVTDMVETRIQDYLGHFENDANRQFDVYHAHDGISANALATLRERGLIGGFARTVHHIDDFDDARLSQLQERAVTSAQKHFVVSELWQKKLAARYALESVVVGNGVDLRRYSPEPDGREAAVRDKYGLGEGPIFLAIGGIEERKNTGRVIEAFKQVVCVYPQAQLVIAGGASILDHHWYRRAVRDALAGSQFRVNSVIETGPVPDEDMPALYRLASALIFPSLREGFGLVVLEAMASHVPVVTSQIEPFTEYLSDEVVWCDPMNVTSIANSMLVAVSEPLRTRLIARGAGVVTQHSWSKTAERHLGSYFELQQESEYA
ncbi:MAG: MSMEG_0565 family glycosyltransferase [Bradyrhizobiaceae bacterium]|nr:MAG: MSMEG_0565 family glycosyltransferase [Bradyrhizobiaceae bacterium]